MGVGGRKRSARCMPGLGLVGQRGGEERREEAGLGSGGDWEAGGRLRLGAWAWSVKFGGGSWVGSMAALQKEKFLLLSSPQATTSRSL